MPPHERADEQELHEPQVPPAAAAGRAAAPPGDGVREKGAEWEGYHISVLNAILDP